MRERPSPPDVISLRRAFHRHPEVGFTEFWTASRVVGELTRIGFNVAVGAEVQDPGARRGVPSAEELAAARDRAQRDGADPEVVNRMEGGLTAVVATLAGRRPGPTVGFRFDMDALPIEESTTPHHLPAREGFASGYGGSMHACGHDGHTAIGLTLAARMADGDFAGTLKLLFQPAEEGGRGARSMVAGGAVDDLDRLFCMHLGTGPGMGEICGGSHGHFATSKLAVTLTGVPAHAAGAPQLGRNALVGAATALLNIHAMPRFSTSDTRINVGQLIGGTGTNIIPHHARMAVETRAQDPDVNQELERRVRAIVAAAAEMHELQHDVELVGEAWTISCDDELVDVVLEEARQVDGFYSFQRSHAAIGSEDASLLMRHVQERGGKATYMVVGTSIAAPHHNDRFDFDEEALPLAVELLERVARRSLDG